MFNLLFHFLLSCSDFHELLKHELLKSEYDLGADYMEMIIQVRSLTDP